MNDGSSSGADDQNTLVQRAISTALVPVQVAISRPAIKTYLSAILFITASFILLSLSTAAYLFFYYNYIPQIDLSRVIYLQYGAGPYPHATVPLETSALVSQQSYDITIELHIPRTPSNLAAGNFMLELSLLTDSAKTVPSKLSSVLPNASSILPYTALATSRRPAILPYSSLIISLATTFVSLPWHILSLRDLDAHHLSIPMFEHLSFARGSSVPSAIRLELQSEYILQIYSAKIVFQAKFEGLRYLIYNYRVLSFLVFSGLFYSVTLLSMGIAWLLVSALFSGSKKNDPAKRDPAQNPQRIKTEPDEAAEKARLSNGHIKTEPTEKSKGKLTQSALLESDSESDHGLSLSNISDSATTFPGIGRQMPLRMPVRNSNHGSSSQAAGPGRNSHENTIVEPLPGQAQMKSEDVADDEDEDDQAEVEVEAESRGRQRDFDSGIGTSMESENAAAAAAAGLSRRRSNRNLSGGSR